MYDTYRFYQVFGTEDQFVDEWEQSGVFQHTMKVDDHDNIIPIISEEKVRLLFYLLFSKYGNNPIANQDVNQFKYRVFTTMFQYGPTWEKRLEIQDKLRGLSETDLMAGTKMVYNHAFNPSASPATTSLDEINAINEQNTSGTKRGKIEAYAVLADLLATDVTSEFLNRFQSLFLNFVSPFTTAIFETPEEEEEE